MGVAQVNTLNRGLANGDIVIARSELLKTTTKAGSAVILHPSSFPWLKTLVKVFERYRFVSLALEYRPLVGTQTPGSFTMGVDWMTNTVKTALTKHGDLTLALGTIDKPAILALTPSVDSPVWQPVKRLVIPPSILNTRLWYVTDAPDASSNVEDYTPAYIVQQSSDDNQGEVWIHYKVHLSGTRNST